MEKDFENWANEYLEIDYGLSKFQKQNKPFILVLNDIKRMFYFLEEEVLINLVAGFITKKSNTTPLISMKKVAVFKT